MWEIKWSLWYSLQPVEASNLIEEYIHTNRILKYNINDKEKNDPLAFRILGTNIWRGDRKGSGGGFEVDCDQRVKFYMADTVSEWRCSRKTVLSGLDVRRQVCKDAGKVIMESFKYQAEKIEPCLSSNCCSAVPTACRAFPPEHAMTTRTQFIKSESTSSLPKSMPPFNFPLWVMATSFKQPPNKSYQFFQMPLTINFFIQQSTSPCLSLISSHLGC